MQTRALIPENASSQSMSCSFFLTDISVRDDDGVGRITPARNASKKDAYYRSHEKYTRPPQELSEECTKCRTNICSNGCHSSEECEDHILLLLLLLAGCEGCLEERQAVGLHKS
jgi:hypothetical protein